MEVQGTTRRQGRNEVCESMSEKQKGACGAYGLAGSWEGGEHTGEGRESRWGPSQEKTA